MEQFVIALKEELAVSLESISFESDTRLRAFKSSEAVKDCCARLRDFIAGYQFANLNEEISYFKLLAPSIYEHLFYYTKEYDIEFAKHYRSRDKLDALMVFELQATEQFYEKHQAFHKYLFEHDSSMDDRYFVRNNAENTMRDVVEVFMGAGFSVGCYYAALVRANERLKTYLNAQLESLRRPTATETLTAPDLEWTGSTTDLVELLTALFLSGSFNHGKATLKDITRWFEVHLKIKFKNFHNILQEIKRRKTNTAKFLGRCADLIVKKSEEDEED